MVEFGVLEAGTKLEHLLDRVQAGEEVVITRLGKPVARLVASGPAIYRQAAEAAAERIIARSRGVTLGGIKVKDLIENGRR